jgi:hypothetical protein
MSDDRLGGIALIAGSVAMLVTMAFHPWGHQFTEENYFAMALLNGLVHTLGIASMAISFLGAIALWRRLDAPGRQALAALVVFGISAVAGICAATISGFVAPHLLHRLWESDAADKKYWDAVEHLSWWMNQAFAHVLVLASATSVLLWSLAMLRTRRLSRGVAQYGIVLAPVLILAVGSGHVQLDVHGFGLIVLLQSVWFILVGRDLMRATPMQTQ